MAAYTTIDDGGSFARTVLYTGTGSSLGVTGVGFQPDFTWIKNRDVTDFHVLTDAVRGATKYLSSNATTAEVTDAESLKSFDSDGFTVGTMNEVNTSTEDYVSWNWKAGTTTGIAGSPTITPTSYSFNATSGFSIIAYTGTGVAATLPHGLSVAPKMIFVKKVGDTDGWGSYHFNMDATAPEDYYMFMNTSAARVNSTMWNDTAPTSTLFSIGTGGDVNNSGTTFIAYCFAPVQGYSKLGFYVGNGDSSDGAFIYTGFRPSWVLIKRSDAGVEDWMIWNDKMAGYNLVNINLYASATNSEVGSNELSLLSNGFKLYTGNSGLNASGVTCIYMAFAKAPFVNSNGVPGNAR